MISRAAELDPVSQAINRDKGLVLNYRREYDAASDMARRTLDLDPTYGAAHRLPSLCKQGKEMFDEAIVENQEWGSITNNRIETEVSLAQIYAMSSRDEEARQLAAKVKKTGAGLEIFVADWPSSMPVSAKTTRHSNGSKRASSAEKKHY